MAFRPRWTRSGWRRLCMVLRISGPLAPGPDLDPVREDRAHRLELLVHPALLRPRRPEEPLVASPGRDEHEHLALLPAPGPPPPLDRPDLRRYRLVEDDAVGRGDVQPLLTDRGRDEHVHLALAEPVEDRHLLLLPQSAVAVPRADRKS